MPIRNRISPPKIIITYLPENLSWGGEGEGVLNFHQSEIQPAISIANKIGKIGK